MEGPFTTTSVILTTDEEYLMVAAIEWEALWRKVTGFLSFFGALANICGNGLTVLAIIRFKNLREVISNYFIVSLSIGDLLLVPGLLSAPASLYKEHTVANGRFYGFLVQIPVILSLWLSSLTLLSITIDRFIAVNKPTAYRRIMTKKLALIIIGINWFVCCGLLLPFMLYYCVVAEPWMIVDAVNSTLEWFPHDFNIVFTILGLIVPSVVAILYATVFIQLRSRIRLKKKIVPVMMSAGNDVSSCDEASKRSRRRTKMLTILVFSVLFSFIPVNIFLAQRKVPATETSKIIFRLCVMNNLAIGLLNPVIYCWQNKDFRIAFRTLLRCKSV